MALSVFSSSQPIMMSAVLRRVEDLKRCSDSCRRREIRTRTGKKRKSCLTSQRSDRNASFLRWEKMKVLKRGLRDIVSIVGLHV